MFVIHLAISNHRLALLRKGGASVLLVCLLFGAGCSNLRPTESGFLDNYSRMDMVEDRSIREFVDPSVDWTRYDAVYIEPVVLKLGDKQSVEFTSEEIEQLTNDLAKALQTTLGQNRSLVDRAFPGALTVKAAVTGLDESNPFINVVTAAALFVPIDSGGVVIELEVCDASTDRQLYAVIHAENGMPWQFFDHFSRFGHAKSAIKAFAEKLAERITPSG